MRKRIWELDALRGSCILAMVGIHLIYDLSGLYSWQPGPLYAAVKQWGGGIFFLIAGVSATLGRHPVRRGLQVFLCGLLCTAATAAVHLCGFSGKELLIYFGTLHCLGLCMLLWPVFRTVPTPLLATAGLLLSAVGIKLLLQPVPGPSWLLPLGFLPPNLATSDYFPLLPYLGLFLLGACLGRRFYRRGESLLSFAPPLPARFLCACGRHALPIYLLHQPILTVVLIFLPGAIQL